MDLYGRPGSADTEFDDPVRRCRLRPPTVLLFGLPLHQLRDLAVDARRPHRVPHAHSVEYALPAG
ncbi:hypothetical protein AB0P05_35850 [Streptomyces flaveolus]|uniref:hypothetical protein n=1 Tax=Streptomyces flaveolus TaxID=67297 RepID=UPI00342A1091